ncbi:hypothetical protein BZK31_12400 [Pseudomonas floridensis]|uniref:RHS repeat-associated core domain-containing protein n=1 Tax=Pseudomonas floridensis TaxID=1958950 RepID=A0A1X0N5Z5_9PSED|nr:hypothetical protein BZK31_12400 [Pseudomonas floridensis]
MSPFGKGGLNAYAYCLGDPVNRKDPTGRGAVIPGLYDFLLNTVSRFKNPFQEPRNFAPLRLHNYRKDGALGLYDQVKKNGTISLVIDTHGDDPGPEGKPAIFVQEDLAVGPKRFARHVKKYDIARYKGIHLVACYSANLGEKSIAAVLAKQTGLPVKGYEGKVMVSELWNSVHQENRLEGIYKELPPYLYNPRTFYPDGTQSAIRKS